jgi:large subunit ribosomal protein L1
MKKRSKAYRAADSMIDRTRLYSPLEAVRLAQKTSPTKYDATVEVAFRLGVDPRKARAAGADIVGGDELIDKVAGGFTDFDAAVATPDLMGKVGRLGKVLGPRGLMPNPKTGTVTMDVAKAVAEIKGGKIEFRVDKHGNLHFIIGKVSFTDLQLVENYAAVLDEVLRLKPSAAKGRYLQKSTFATTMGPGVPVDPNRSKNLTVEDAEVA